MKTGSTSVLECASRTSARGYTTIALVAIATSVAFTLNASALAQGTQTPRNTQQTEGRGQPTSGRLIVPITGAADTAALLPQTETPTAPPETTTTPPTPETPVVEAAATPDMTGSFSIRRFARTTDDGIAAIGTLTMSVTDTTTNAARTVVTELAMPIARSSDSGTSIPADTEPQTTSSTSLASPSATALPCETLRLVLGPLQLDLLGNAVQLNEANLDIIAVPGASGPLRSLLCDVAGLMEGAAPPAQIVRRLNTLLDTLG